MMSSKVILSKKYLIGCESFRRTGVCVAKCLHSSIFFMTIEVCQT